MSVYNELLKEICLEKNISLTIKSKGWEYILEKDHQTRYILGYHFDLNNAAISSVLDDKYAFYELLTYKNYPINKHHILFKNYNQKEVKELFNEYNKDVVIKTNIGTCGDGVYRIQDENVLFEILDKLLNHNYSVSLCPYLDIKEEYRVIILSNQAELVYGKVKPVVVGNGKDSIKELLTKFNPHFFGKLEGLPTDILPENTEYMYDWKFNLSKGANINLELSDELKSRLTDLAESIARDINIKFCSIDITLDKNNNLSVMEANSGVMMENFIFLVPNGRNIAKKIYSKAINLMFEE